ncbi:MULTISPECIES: autotransporter domain-containing protein [Pseudomonas]|uniref:Autotransporter domain-containing protein n=1 Tax=Pseudomonas quercus TaxID=2722792 RepID=A0ABX0YFL0_9PSED|nr:MULTISPECIES: autotransporter domain-containing protein [Pseudomonas]MBF7142626.1 autotransporter domain-containing protein [Pseudomonas sp. LY10J]NJP01164.1 autotransporter domain-containing protein [Pseudomonas quercus]
MPPYARRLTTRTTTGAWVSLEIVMCVAIVSGYAHPARAADVVDFSASTGSDFIPAYLSADGATAAGSRIDEQGIAHVATWRAGTFDTLTDVATAQAHGLSDDGKVVVGSFQQSVGGATRAFRWEHGAIEDLGTLGGTTSYAQGVSADGAVVVGYSTVASDSQTLAFRWQNGHLQALGTLGGQNAYARAVSADGQAVAGDSTIASGNQHAFLWKNNTLLDLGTLGGDYSQSVGVNADGTVVVGTSLLADNGFGHAFRWSGGTMTDLGTLGGHYSVAQFVSADGRVVVGRSILADNLNTRAFRWEDGTLTDLGTLGGTAVYARDMSPSGAIVVGDGLNAANEHQAFYWNTAKGMRTLEAWLSDNGFAVNMDNARAVKATGVSDDGNVVIGQLSNGHNYLARVVTPASTDPVTSTPVTPLPTTPTPITAAPTTPTPTSITPSPAPIATTPTTPAVTTPVSEPVSVPQPALEPAPVSTPVPSVQTPELAPSTGGVASPADPLPTTAPTTGGGLIDMSDFMAGIAQVRVQASTMAAKDADLTLNGLHGDPMRHRLEAGKQRAWVSGDIGRHSHNAYEGDAGVGEIGYGVGVTDGLQFNMAFGLTGSQQKGSNGSDIKVRGVYALPEMIARLPDTSLYVTLSGLYNHGTSDIDRGYRNAGVQRASSGDANTTSWGSRVRVDWLDAFEVGATRFTPYVSHTYLHTALDHYTESGGGFPVAWEGNNSRTNTSRAGLDAVHSVNQRLTLLGRVETAKRYEPRGPAVKGKLLGAGGGAFDLPGTDYAAHWLRAGTGAEVKVGAGVASLMLNATTEGEAPTYWGTVGYELTF